MQPDWSMLPPLTWLSHDTFACFRRFVGGAEACAPIRSSLAQVVRMSATQNRGASDMAKHLARPCTA
jgi:hypothetical protein